MLLHKVVLDDSMLVLDDNMLQVHECSERVMNLGALTHTKPQESYFVVVYLFRILIKT